MILLTGKRSTEISNRVSFEIIFSPSTYSVVNSDKHPK